MLNISSIANDLRRAPLQEVLRAHIPSDDPQGPQDPHKPPPPQPADEPPPVPEGDPPSDAPPERAENFRRHRHPRWFAPAKLSITPPPPPPTIHPLLRRHRG